MIFSPRIRIIIYIIINFNSIQSELNFFAWIFVFLPCCLITIYNRCYDQCLHGMFKLIENTSTKLNFFKTLFSRKRYMWWQSWYNNVYMLISIFNSTFLKPYSTFLSLLMLSISEQKNSTCWTQELIIIFIFYCWFWCIVVWPWTRKKTISVLAMSLS